nr:phosphate/phosphite/phosphonate ABC transporter substrate-binding protein [Halosolutus amylolyticus]
MLSDSFDPENPGWEDNNYLLSQVVENDYIRGRRANLESMASRDVDEVPHGNPVTEPPTDESELVDPDPLVFVDQPGEEGEAQFQDNVQDLLDRLEEATGKTVQWEPVDSYAATVEALRSGRAHIGNVSTGTTAFAVNLADVVPFACGVQSDGQFGYRLLAITRSDMDDIQSVEDFPEFDVTHTEPASNSGHQAPSALFDQYFDVTPEEDYEVQFSGGHDQSAIGISAGDYDCGPICSTCIQDLVESRDDIDFEDYKVVWASDPFPPGPMVHRYDLEPDLVADIKSVWLDTDWSGTGYEESTNYAEFVEIDYRSVFYDIMVIQRYNGVEYESGNL